MKQISYKEDIEDAKKESGRMAKQEMPRACEYAPPAKSLKISFYLPGFAVEALAFLHPDLTPSMAAKKILIKLLLAVYNDRKEGRH